MDEITEKVKVIPRWIWISLLAIALASLLFRMIPTLAERKTTPAISAISEEKGTIYFLPGEIEKEVELKPGVWTKWIGLPPFVQYRIDTENYENEIKIKYIDGTIFTLGDEPVDLGLRQGVFRLLSQQREKATIIIN